MASEQRTYTQSYFHGGISQTPFTANETQVADCENVSLTERIGEVFPSHRNREDDLNSTILGTPPFEFLPQGASMKAEALEITLFQNGAYFLINRFASGARIQRGQITENTFRPPLFTLYVPQWDRNLFIVDSATVDDATVRADPSGYAVYSLPNEGSSSLLAKVRNIAGDPLFTLDPEEGSEYPSYLINYVLVDNSVYLSIHNTIYRLELLSSGEITQDAVLTLPVDEGIRKMTIHGDFLQVYTTQTRDIAVEKNNTENDEEVSDFRNKSFRYIWQRTRDAWEDREEINGLLLDVTEHNGIDYIFTDTAIGYFSGDVFVVLKNLPTKDLELVLPNSAVSVDNYVVFATSNFERQTGSNYLIGRGVRLWTFGREQDDNPLSLQPYTRMAFPARNPPYDELNHGGYFYLTRSGNTAFNGNLTFAFAKRMYARMWSNVINNSVEYQITHWSVDETVSTSYTSTIFPVHTQAGGFVEEGFFTTRAIRSTSGMQITLESVNVTADISINSRLMIVAILDGGEEREITTLQGQEGLSTSLNVGVRELPRCGYFQLKFILQGSQTVAPTIYSVGATYSESETL